MQMNQADTRFAFTVQAAVRTAEPTFSSVWGNEMQREDFLALAAGVRQFSATQVDLSSVSMATPASTEAGPYAAE